VLPAVDRQDPSCSLFGRRKFGMFTPRLSICISIAPQVCRSCLTILLVPYTRHLDSRPSRSFALPNTAIRWLFSLSIRLPSLLLHFKANPDHVSRSACAEPLANSSRMRIMSRHITVTSTTYAEWVARWTPPFPCVLMRCSMRSFPDNRLSEINFPKPIPWVCRVDPYA